jgi:hypothetical protein
MNTPTVSCLALLGALGLLAGCASEPASHLVTAPPPLPPTMAPAPQTIVVTQQPQQVLVAQPQQQVVATLAAPAGVNSYVVMQAPPAAPPEAVPTRPTTQHKWIPGYWTWQNNQYAWMAGHWEVPPYTAAVWVNPRWAPEGNAYRFYEGHWN